MIKRSLKIAFFLFFALSIYKPYSASAQLPQCDKIYMDRYLLLGLGGPTTEILAYDPSLPVGPGNPALNTIAFPAGMEHGGLTVSAVLNSANTTRTFYTMMGATLQTATLWYYDPATLTWVNTGHTMGDWRAINLAAGGPYIYGQVGVTGEIYQYDGNGNGSLLVTVSDFAGKGPYDLVADCDGNVYIFNGTGNPGSLRKYSPTGALLQSWTLTAPAGYTPSAGFAIIGNSFFTDYLAGFLIPQIYIASGNLSGTAVNITTISPPIPAPFTLGDIIGDLASCDQAILRLADISIAATDTAFCGSREVTYWVTGVVNAGATPAYQWLINGAPAAGATDTFFTYTPQNGDVINCQMVSGDRCVTQVTVTSNPLTMAVENAVQPELRYEPNEFCTDAPIVLPILNNTGGTFAAGGGLSLDNTTGAIDPAQSTPGEYLITYTNPPAVLCPLYSTATIVNVYPLALAKIETLPFDEPVCLDDTVALHALETRGNKYFWEPLGRIAGAGDLPEVVIKRNQSGMVRLTVYAKGGCFAKDSLFIDAGRSCCKVFVPNAFSPNNDGLNDTWKVATEAIRSLNSLVIYNRFGQPIFETQNVKEGWDGTQEGKPCDIGVYYYTLLYTCDNGVAKEKKGEITLMR